MAGQGTHVRLAVDLSKQLQVNQLSEYLSGTIYPDSRYWTKIDRNLTHPAGFLRDKSFFVGDFKKGWYVHLLCDQLQIDVIKNDFSDLFQSGKEPFYGDALWTFLTAIKFIQDNEDMKDFSINEYLQYLVFHKNPNGENIELLTAYYGMVYSVYVNNRGLSLDNKYDFFLKISQDKVVVDKCKNQVDVYLRNPEKVLAIRGIYKKMLDKAAKVLEGGLPVMGV